MFSGWAFTKQSNSHISRILIHCVQRCCCTRNRCYLLISKFHDIFFYNVQKSQLTCLRMWNRGLFNVTLHCFVTLVIIKCVNSFSTGKFDGKLHPSWQKLSLFLNLKCILEMRIKLSAYRYV